MALPSDKTIRRLSLYRRVLQDLLVEGTHQVYSRQFGRRSGVGATQIRRDFMSLGYSGSSGHGYNIRKLVNSITQLLDSPQAQNVAIVGLGSLGRTVLAHFAARPTSLNFVAAFDNDPQKIDHMVHSCRCYPLDRLTQIVQQQQISLAVLAVPAAQAQGVATLLVDAGIRGILNLTYLPVETPPHVHTEHIDLTSALEKLAFFTRQLPTPA